MADLPSLSYPRLRRLAVQAAVLRALRRWGMWGLMALGLLAAVSNTPEVALAGLAMMLVPLWWSSGQSGGMGWLQWAGVTLLYALLGWAWLRAWRSAVWPAHWRAAEASLPLPMACVQRTDRHMLAVVLAPWAVLLFTAWGLLWAWQPGPAWAQASRAALGLSLALGLGLAAAERSLRRWRCLAPPTWAGAAPASPRPTTSWSPRPAGWALVLAPLLRGSAPLSLQALSVGLLMPALALGGAAWSPHWATAWLCGATAVALVCTALTLRRLTLELAALQAASTALPLPPTVWHHWQRGVAALPVALWVLCLGLALATATLPLRPGPTLGLMLCLAVAGGLETHWPVSKPEHHASRWLLMLCLCLAWASELTPT
ncbi:hypothetical protein [Ideonella paludis]|uniref:Uncharacterized protein n=1 Tax=Ideonella paludis TaxID=1233411 RepID=A0ABS5DX25_9BURK|nr:hypothetical protein [Ideonella paludis]MBQ0935697.1 hypothetical protein [Ideonella paludis]